jgi:hypothetical protein
MSTLQFNDEEWEYINCPICRKKNWKYTYSTFVVNDLISPEVRAEQQQLFNEEMDTLIMCRNVVQEIIKKITK